MQGTIVESGETTVRASESLEQTSGRLRRRIDRFRRAGLLEHVDAIHIEQAVTADELRAAYSLVHDVFVFQNYTTPQPGGMRLRPCEALPDMATFVAKVNGRVIAVMSLAPDAPGLGLPSDKAYRNELDALRRQGHRINETTNLAVADEYRNSPAFFELVRCGVAYSLNNGFDDNFISISPGHAMFFQAILSFEECGGRRNYGGATVDMVEGMRLNFHTMEAKMLQADASLGDAAFLHDWFFKSNPHFASTAKSAVKAAGNFMDPGFLRQVFVEQEDLATRWGPEAMEAIRNRWGSQLFAKVFDRLAIAPENLRQLAA
jgi:hypothetical protein